MAECERVENKEADDKVLNTQEQIIEMVKNIKNEKYLRFIWELLKSFKKKWGI